MKNRTFVLSLSAAVALLTTTASADTIYSDTFSGTSPLTGTTTGGSETGTWSASGFVNDNGTSVYSATSSSDVGAFLPFTPTDGNIYTLSVTLASAEPSADTSDNGQWIGLGYTDSASTASAFWSNSPQDWEVLTPVDNVQILTGGFSEGGFTGQQGDTYTLILNTTNSNQWSFTSQDGSISQTFDTAATPQSIAYVGFGTNGAEDGSSFTVSNFSLSVQSTPEPSSFVLVALGMVAWVGVVGLRRLRKI